MRAQSRLRLRDDGKIVYELRKPTASGRRQVVFEPEAFIRRLAALIPPPYQNLTRFHGVFAPAAKARAAVIALAPQNVEPEPGCEPTTENDTKGIDPLIENATTPGTHRLPWAELLKRTMGVDVQTCPRCGGKMRLIQLVKDKPVIDKILTHLNLPTAPPPVAPARPPPQTEFDYCD